MTYYNQVHEVDEKKPCEHFKLNVTIEESSGNSSSHMVSYLHDVLLFCVVSILLAEIT